MIITIDGPAGSGKSSVAKKLAEKLHFTYVETGALYRALTYGCIIHGIDLNDPLAVDSYLSAYPVRIILKDDAKRYVLGSLDVTEHLRDDAVTQLVSRVSALAAVRKSLLDIQRQAATTGTVIFDGRDMGTAVFPNAEVKIFLTASLEIRATRRLDDLGSNPPPLANLIADIRQRDALDASRDICPLHPAPDALIIDTSNLTLDEVVDIIAAAVSKQC